MKLCQFFLIPAFLTLFDDGGATGTPAAGDGAENGDTGAEAPSGENGSPPAAGEDSTNDTTKDRKAEYERLIKGDFKDMYTEDTQRIINKRLAKERGQFEAHKAVTQPLLERLGQRYGKTADDVTGIVEALDADETLWESAAQEAGYDDVEQYKYVKQLEQEAAYSRQMHDAIEEQQQAMEIYNHWMQEAEALKEEFSDFNLIAECQTNPQFVNLLRSGIGIKAAYQVAHMDEIKASVAQAQKQQTVQNIQARGIRPMENGASSSPAAKAQNAFARMSNREILALSRRIVNGERV